jgi:hypothetical protein
VETEKLRKYDILANELTQVYGFKSKIILYVLTWDGVVSMYHEMYRTRLELSDRIESYIQYLVLKKTLKEISLDFNRKKNLEEFLGPERNVYLKNP